MKNWFRKYRLPIGVAIALVIILCLVILVDIFKAEYWLAGRVFDFLDGWAMVLSAAAMVTLAVVAFWTVRKTIAENRRIRDEDKESDFKRRCLDDIRNWALKAIPHFTQDLSMQSKHPLELQRNVLASISAEIASVVRASSSFNNDFQLAVKEATRNLEEYFNLLNRVIMQWPETTEQGFLPKLTDDTRRSLVKLLQSVADLKVKLQL